jgi:acyl-coenzyme A thioesterase PaaI-like protein
MTVRPSKPVEPVVFEPEYLQGVRDIFERKIVFNQTLGLKITDIQPLVVTATIPMRDDLVGHYSDHRVHGGVISACIDTIGAAACFVALGARHLDEPVVKRLERFLKLGTIDLRVDYLRPGLGTHFNIRAEAIRVGSRVGNARIEFTAADGLLVSTGTGAYIMS